MQGKNLKYLGVGGEVMADTNPKIGYRRIGWQNNVTILNEKNMNWMDEAIYKLAIAYDADAATNKFAFRQHTHNSIKDLLGEFEPVSGENWVLGVDEDGKIKLVRATFIEYPAAEGQKF